MKFLGGLFESKADGASLPTPGGDSGSVSRVRGGSASLFGGGSAYDSDKAVRQFYERVMWVFRCCDAIADNSSRLPVVVVQGDGDNAKEIKHQDIWRLLNKRPNKYETATQFRYRVSTLLLLSKKGVFIECVPARNDDSRVAEMHLLPLSTNPVKDKKKFVSGFEVRGDDNKKYTLPVFGTPEAKGKNAVIWIRSKPHPTDPYSQMTPLMSAGLAADTDYFARLFNRNFMQNDGRPGMLIAIRGKLGQTDALEIKNYFAGGLMQAGATRVIEADDISVADMSGSPRDAQYVETLRGTKEDIMMAFGVSESFLGNASGRTFDNADAEFEITWTTTMISHLNAIDNGLDPLTGDVNDDQYVKHDLSKVDVLQRIERRRQDKALEHWQLGLTTWDETREVLGHKPWDVVGSRVAYLPSGIAIAKNPEDQAAITTLKPPAQQEETGAPVGNGLGNDELSQEEQSRRGALQGSSDAAGVIRNIESARRLRLAGKILALAKIERKALPSGTNVIQGEVEKEEDQTVEAVGTKAHPYDHLRGRIEAECGAVLSAWSRRQEKTVLARVSGPGATQHTRHYVGAKVGTKALNATTVVKPDQWAKDIREDIEDIIRKEALAQLRRTGVELDKRGVLAVLGKSGRGNPIDRLTGKAEDDVVSSVIDPILDMVQESGRKQSERVADVIQQMDDDGASMTEIKAEVKRMIGSRSSWFKGLAVHATTAAIEGVQAEALGHAGKAIVRTWHTEADEKVRKTHWENEGEEKTGGKPFVVGKTLMMYPGDPLAPVGETANCRCWVTWTPAKSVVIQRGRATRAASRG